MIVTKQITSHTELLNALIKKYNLKSYLEIGVHNPDNNFNNIGGYPIQIKIGVDPALITVTIPCSGEIKGVTSDDFFKDNTAIFDLIFIDGLHHADQVKRDFENSLRCLSDNGFIVIHDCLPIEESTTHVPRDSKVWHGDVYKFAMTLCEYDGIDFRACEKGGRCLWVWKDSTKKGVENWLPKDWNTYKQLGREFLNVVDEVII